MLNIPECVNPACSFVLLLFVVAVLLKFANVTLSSLVAVALMTRPGTMTVKDSTKHTPQLHAGLRGEIPFTEGIQSWISLLPFIIY